MYTLVTCNNESHVQCINTGKCMNVDGVHYMYLLIHILRAKFANSWQKNCMSVINANAHDRVNTHPFLL